MRLGFVYALSLVGNRIRALTRLGPVFLGIGLTWRLLYSRLEAQTPKVWWDRTQSVSACRPKNIAELVAPVEISPFAEPGQGLPLSSFRYAAQLNSGFGFRRGWQFHYRAWI
jgi:hypothetical protein